LSLLESAQSRGLEFNLSIENLSDILRKKTCHFSGQDLVHFPHDPKEVESGALTLPDNYLSIDRLDANVGYVDGNVAACGRAINELKDRMDDAAFKQLIAKQQLLAQAGISAEELKQLAALSTLSNSPA